MDLKDKKVKANPTKNFFVRMITRDIGLDDCILDLIDNAVDSAWAQEGSQPSELSSEIKLESYNIHINTTKDVFSIRDNCGGMSLTDATEYAFSFGRNEDSRTHEYSIGVYGIGMKRAVFKLGSCIRIQSTVVEDDETYSFLVPIDVDDWVSRNDPVWDFDIEEAEDLAEAGLQITVEKLAKGTASSLKNPAFLEDLRRTISRDYSLHIQQGLSIFLNEKHVEGWSLELKSSDVYKPAKVTYDDKEGASIVRVEIIAGMAASPPENPGDSESQSNDGDRKDGWYVACNSRIILAADKSKTSGWGGDSLPRWHYQYAGFIGIVLFYASEPAALPMTTTKRNIDESSEVYRRARVHMNKIAREWIDYTNRRKLDIVEAKSLEKAAKPVNFRDLANDQDSEVKLPPLKSTPKVKQANVLYSVDQKRLKKLANELGDINMTYRDVGIKSFDYTYDDLVGED